MRAVALAVLVMLGGSARAAGTSAAELRTTLFPRSNARELGIRDEDGRPLYLASFDWARWPKMAPGIYVALAVATTVRGVGPGAACDRQRGPVPGGVVLAVLKKEPRRVRGRKQVRVVAQDTRPITFGCVDGNTIEAITLDAGPYPLSDVEQLVGVRTRTKTSQEIRLFRFAWELRVVLETEAQTLEPKKGRGFYDYVQTAPASQPASQPATPRKTTTRLRWNGTRFAPVPQRL
jgi:hypothetical protein